MAYGEEAGTAAGNDDITDTVDDIDSGGTTDSAEDAQDSFASDDDDFTPTSTDSAEDAQDSFASDDDDFRMPRDSAEDAQDAFAAAGDSDAAADTFASESGTPDVQTPRTSAGDQGIEDTIDDAQAGSGGSRSPAVTDAVGTLQRRVGSEIPGIDASETEKFDIKRQGDELEAVLTAEGLVEARQAARAQAEPVIPTQRRTRVDPAFRDQLGSAEAAQDRAGRGETILPDLGTLDDPKTAEAAADGVASGRLDAASQFTTTRFASPELRRAVGDAQSTVDAAGSQEDGLFAPDRAPDRPASNPITGTLRDATGLPSERELTADLRAITDLPSEQELAAGAQEQLRAPSEQELTEGAREQTGAPSETELSAGSREGAAQLVAAAQENPRRAVAVGLPVAAAEPTPVGEAALIGGAAAGVLGIDAARRLRAEDDQGQDVPAEPFGGGEIDTPERPVGEQSELDAPDRVAVNQGEVDVPTDRPARTGELEVPDRPADTRQNELDVPVDGEQSPFTIQAAQAIGRQRGRDPTTGSRRRQRRDSSIPDRFIPDEDVTIGEDVVEPEIDSGGEFRNVDRPDQGVRTFNDDSAEPPVDEEGSTRTDTVDVPQTISRTLGGSSVISPLARDEQADLAGDVANFPRSRIDVDVASVQDVGQRARLAQQPRQAQQAALETPTVPRLQAPFPLRAVEENQQRQRPAVRQTTRTQRLGRDVDLDPDLGDDDDRRFFDEFDRVDEFGVASAEQLDDIADSALGEFEDEDFTR